MVPDQAKPDDRLTPDIIGGDVVRIVQQLQEVAKLEQQLCDHAELGRVLPEGEIVRHPTAFVTALRAQGSPFAGKVFRWFMALEGTLVRLKRQIAWFNAYNVWCDLDIGRAVLNHEDRKSREHFGYAVCHLYTAWNQFARLLDQALAWRWPNGVYPFVIKEKGKDDPLKDDPWLKELVERYDATAELFGFRHLESHDLGLADLMFDDVVTAVNQAEGDAAAKVRSGIDAKLKDAQANFEALRNAYNFLVQVYRGLAPFLERVADQVGPRHAAEISNWQGHVRPQKHASTGCVPTGIEFLLRAAGVQGVKFSTLQEDFDLKRAGTGDNNFMSVSTAVMEKYKGFVLRAQSFDKGEGLKKAEKIVALVQEGTPCLLSLPVDRGDGSFAAHIVPVVEAGESITVVAKVKRGSAPETMAFTREEIAEKHDEHHPSCNDIMWIEKTET